MSEIHHVDFDGHRVAYHVAGQGPAVVMLNLYRRREDRMRARLVQNGWQVFHVAPLGYGYSDRVPGYAGEALPDQILTVLDHHGVTASSSGDPRPAARWRPVSLEGHRE